MFPVMKNAYLQHVMTVPPRLINRMVNEAMSNDTAGEDLEPPFLPKPCQTPYNFAPETDSTRARPAFLHWALPKLIAGLHSKDIVTRRRSLATLSDMLRDPEKAFEAMKLNIVQRMTDLLLHEESYIRERTCFVLGVIGNHSDGGQRILAIPLMCKHLQNCLEDVHPMVQVQAASTIEILSRTPWVCDGMLSLEFPKNVTDAIKEQELEATCVILLEALHNMIARRPDLGCDLELIDLMMELIESEIDDERIQSQCCKIIAQIATCARGQMEADEKDILPGIIKLIYDERPKVHTHAAMAFQSITISTRSRWRCREFQQLPGRLTVMAGYRKNVTCQIYAMQSLQNICALPVIRESMLEHCLEKIKDIQTNHSQLLDRLKTRLLANINWVPYDTSTKFDGLEEQSVKGHKSTPSTLSYDDMEHICPCKCLPREEATSSDESYGNTSEMVSETANAGEEKMQNITEPVQEFQKS